MVKGGAATEDSADCGVELVVGWYSVCFTKNNNTRRREMMMDFIFKYSQEIIIGGVSTNQTMETKLRQVSHTIPSPTGGR